MIKPLGIDPSYRGFGASCGKDTIVIATEPIDTQTISQNCQRRAQQIISKLIPFINNNYDSDDELLVVVEAPSFGSHGGHLFEMGFLFCELYNRLPSMIHNKMTIAEIPPSTFKKWLTGKGRSAKGESKADHAKAIKERWGMEFELDRGGNKADSFGLYKLGVAILEGQYDFKPTARRGQGKKRKKNEKQSRDNARALKTAGPKSPRTRGGSLRKQSRASKTS